MAYPIINQEIIFGGDKSTSGATGGYAYFPTSLRGQYAEYTVYVEYSSGSSAGKVQIETAWQVPTVNDYTGTWANVGSSIDYSSTGPIMKYASVTGIFDLLRLEITTTITGGTAKAWVVAAPET